MNILVLDVAAEYGGALSILNEFYKEVIENGDDVNWIFALSKVKLKERENVKILNFEWVKKSWFHRLFFDYMIANLIIKKYECDKVFSLQNIIVPFTNIPQINYVHQAIPFTEYKFSIFKNPKYWIYQNIIGEKIYKSIKNSTKVIVQTEFMKEICIEKANISSEKVTVIKPKFEDDVSGYFKNSEETYHTFFYPASALNYKNHGLVLEACLKLSKENIIDYRVLFTIDSNQNKLSKELYQKVEKYKLPIEFIGRMDKEDVMEMYNDSIMIFPSYIETFGLPLLEARLHKGVIFASNCRFSIEILENYENAYFFDPFDSIELYNLMKKGITNEIEYCISDDDVVKDKKKIIEELI